MESRASDGGQRRSRQAKRRTEALKKAYKEGRESERGETEGGEEEEEAWEEEAEDLYQWTQTLSFDDIR